MCFSEVFSRSITLAAENNNTKKKKKKRKADLGHDKLNYKATKRTVLRLFLLFALQIFYILIIIIIIIINIDRSSCRVKSATDSTHPVSRLTRSQLRGWRLDVAATEDNGRT